VSSAYGKVEAKLDTLYMPAVDGESGQLIAPACYHLGKGPSVPNGWVSTKAGLDVMTKRHMPTSTACCPTRSQSHQVLPKIFLIIGGVGLSP
jgi:hypothetical protein